MGKIVIIMKNVFSHVAGNIDLGAMPSFSLTSGGGGTRMLYRKQVSYLIDT